VRAALRRDPGTRDINVTIECDRGGVKLAGMVDTQDEATAAAKVAAVVEGVKEVDNQLKAASAAASRYRRDG